MTTEETNPPPVVLSTALLERFDEAIGSYWDCAYQEGHLNRPDGDKANAILYEIHCAVAAFQRNERELCKQAIRDTRDKSGVNEDGQSWLQRAGRGDFIAAIDAL